MMRRLPFALLLLLAGSAGAAEPEESLIVNGSFELIEKGAEDEIVGKLEAVIWRRDYREVRRALAAADQEIADGREIRCRATLDFYPPFGRTQLVVREVDAVFALGRLAARRRATLAALGEAGLLERNRGLPLGDVPLDLALVTARDSAAMRRRRAAPSGRRRRAQNAATARGRGYPAPGRLCVSPQARRPRRRPCGRD